MAEIDLEGKIDYSIKYNNSDTKYNKSFGCSEVFMPKTQIFTVMLFIRECVFTIKYIIGDFKVSFNMTREIQLWTSN